MTGAKPSIIWFRKEPLYALPKGLKDIKIFLMLRGLNVPYKSFELCFCSNYRVFRIKKVITSKRCTNVGTWSGFYGIKNRGLRSD